MTDRSDAASQRPDGQLEALLDAVAHPTDLVGRESDLVAVASRLRPGQLITIAGPGGVGKTALADTVAGLVSHLFDDRWWCDLTGAEDRATLDAVVAEAIGARRHEQASAFDAVVDALQGRRALVVLDNVEQVVGAAVAAVTKLLERCPRLTVLATSRVPIGVQSEDVWMLSPLHATTDARRLFTRLLRGQVDHEPLDPVAAGGALNEICADLDGMPLGIELAAGQLGQRSLDDLRHRVGERFAELRRSDRIDRQAAVHAALRFSYDSLEPVDRHLFDRLSVFRGGFTVAGAAAVLGSEAGRLDVPAMLERLVSASMVARSAGGEPARFEMLETTRQFGDRQLAEQGERASVRNAHLEHMVEVAAAFAVRSRGPEWRRASSEFRADRANLRAAVHWAIDAQRSDRVDRLLGDVFFAHRWTLDAEAAGWARRALDRAMVTDATLGAAAHFHVGLDHHLAGDHAAALAAYEAALAASSTAADSSSARCEAADQLRRLQRVDDAATVADAMLAAPPTDAVERAIQGSSGVLAKVAAGRIGADDAIVVAARLHELAASTGNPVALGVVAHDTGVMHAARGEPDEARSAFELAVALAAEHDVPALMRRGLLAQVYELGRPGLVAALAAIDAWSERPDVANEFIVLEGVGINLAELGRLEPAAVVLGHLDQGHLGQGRVDRKGRRLSASTIRREAAAVAVGEGRRGERWTKRGAEMSRAELIEFVRDELDGIVALL